MNCIKTTGWNDNCTYSKDDLFKAISNSWFLVSAYHNEKLIGFGRIISDGVYQTFIGDMIVHPDFQKQGIGSKIMDTLIEKCKSSGIKWILMHQVCRNLFNFLKRLLSSFYYDHKKVVFLFGLKKV
jgi:GNAT superfamily N-acetyltransferase